MIERGKKYDLCGHKVSVTKITLSDYDVPRIRMKCKSDCCTKPFGIIIESTENDLEDIFKLTKVVKNKKRKK